jgi:hypothetical protein
LMIPDELRHFLEVRNTIPSNCVVHRRACLERFGYWPEDTARVADWMLWKTIIQGVGPDRLAYVPLGTSLHFSAAWKEARDAGVPEVATWLRLIEAAGWWPSVLRRAVPAGRPEQRVWFEAIQEGGPKLIDEQRAAVQLMMEHRGWSDILHNLPHIGALKAELADRAAAMQAANVRITNLEAERQTARDQADEMRSAVEAALADHAAAMEAANVRIANLEAERQTACDQSDQMRSMLNQTDAALRQSMEELQTRHVFAAGLQRQLDTILASRSWRVTAPARRLQQLLRGSFQT